LVFPISVHSRPFAVKNLLGNDRISQFAVQRAQRKEIAQLINHKEQEAVWPQPLDVACRAVEIP
jgi:NADH:ubiquinone oxidoreductase subunit B-like Fe-S oxidoreductase